MGFLSEKENRLSFKILGSSFKTGVVEVTLSENVSVPYQADLVLASEDVIAFDDVVGKEGLLTLVGAIDDRLTHGVISRFSQAGKRGRFLIYEARLVPKIWLLSQKRNSRIFQGDGVKEIIEKVLKDGQIPADHAAFRLKEKYKPKDFAVEYQETDLAFVSRLSEEDGIWFFFEQSKDKDVVVFADSTSAYKPIAGDAAIAFNQAEGMPPKEEVVYQWSASKAIVPGKMSQNDFNYTKPSTALKTQEQAKSNTALEVYEHPGRYEDEDTGKRLTKARLEELNAMQETVSGRSTCPRFEAGYTFKLKGHETSAFNREYLIVSVTHHGKEPQVLQEMMSSEPQTYYNDFVAIPSSVALRPPRVTPRPVMMGPQTAIVVGAKGEEIYTDDAGRIKVKFHWDRAEAKDEKSSCWIRVGQLWTGEGWGSMFVPRVGQEVIVSFIDGDPDRPIVTGRVYNGANPPPHALPANKTKSTIMSQSTKGGGGKNELSFEDAKGKEQIILNGQKDLAISVGNDKTQSVGHDEKHTVGNDETYGITGNAAHSVGKDEKRSVGANQTVSITNNRTTSVGANEDVKITGNKSVKVSGNHSESITGNKSEHITGNEETAVTGNRSQKTSGAKTEMVTLASAETIGLAKALSVGAAYQVSVAGVMNESVALAKAEQVGGVKSVVVGKSMSENVTGSRTSVTAKTHSIKAKDISIEGLSSFTIKVGSATLKMSSSGDIELSGKKITVNGSDINMKGSGTVKVTGNKIAQN